MLGERVERSSARCPRGAVTVPILARPYEKASVFLRARSTCASTGGGRFPNRLTRRLLSTALICSVTALEVKAKRAVPLGITAWLGERWEMFGGVTTAVVPDQLKSAVVLPCRYEPGLQKTYEEFARYAGTAILPARPRKPRDKAKAEAGVLVATGWILARLRHGRFFSLAALNARIAELLESLHTRPMRLWAGSQTSPLTPPS